MSRDATEGRFFDVFICYSWGDKDLADQLYDELDALDVSVFKDDESIDDWAEMLPSIRQKLLGSRVLVPLITPRFYESEHCRTELHLALMQSYWLERGKVSRILSVLWQVEPRAVRPRVLKHNKLPKAGKSPAELARQIKAVVTKLEATDPRRFGDAPEVSPPDWFPAPMVTRPRFTGRSDELWELHEALLAKDKPRDRGHPVVSVRGVGGQGKSTLVAQYALWFGEDHPGGVFVIELSGSEDPRLDQVGTRRRFERGLERIADELEIDRDQLRALGVRAAVKRALRQRGPYLWIVDGVPSAVDPELVRAFYAPTAGGKTVFTTRGRLRELVSVELEIDGLRPRDALALLTAEHRPDVRAEVQAARRMVTTLDAHPLGLRLAAGQTLAPDFAGYQALLVDMESTDKEVLELTASLVDVLPVGYVRAFSATVLRSYRHLTDAGRDMLDAVSTLGSDGIPRSLLLDLVTDRTGATEAAPVLDAGITQLSAFGLADEQSIHGDDPQVVVHALVIRGVRVLSAQARRRPWRDSAIRVLTTRMVAPRTTQAEDRLITRELPHVDVAVGPLDARNEWPVGPDEWHLVNEAARVEYEIGDSRRSLSHFRSLATASGKAANCDESTRLRIRVSLASAHANYHEHDTARQILEEVLAELDDADPEADPEVMALVTEVLGNCWAALGDRAKAIALLKRAYRERRAHRGKTDPRTLTALNNLVIVMGADPKSSRSALRYALGAYALWHRTAGPDSRGALDSLTSVGANLLRVNDIDTAYEVFRYVWQRRREVQGELHPDTIGAGENLAHVNELRKGSA